MKSGKYSDGRFSDNGGGYYLVEKSAYPHKAEEIETAKLMSDKGYVIRLKDESGTMRTPDRYAFEAGFEQSTPKGGFCKQLQKLP